MKMRILLILAILPYALPAGAFEWGRVFGDRCGQAREIAIKVIKEQNDEQRRADERRIDELCPDGPAVHFLEGVRSEQTGNLDKAIKEYQETLRLDPDFAEARGNLGVCYLQKGLTDDAAVELTRASRSLSDPRVHQGLARIFSDRKFYTLALYHYGEARKLLPDDPAILAGIAEVYDSMGLVQNAEEGFKKALMQESGFEKARIGLAMLYMKKDQPDRAIAELRNALVINPANKEVHAMLGEILEKRGDREGARKEYALAGRSFDLSPEERLQKGDEYLKAKDYEKAAAEYQLALKGRPDWAEALRKLGDVHMAMGKDEEAIASYREALRNKLESAEIHYNLGVLYERRNLLDEAVVEYRQALRLAPADGDTRRRLADIYTLRGNLPEAIEQYQALLKLRPENPLVHFKLGRLYAASKKFTEAAAAYGEAVRLDSDNLEAHRELASLMRKLGNDGEAEKHYAEVLRLKKDDVDARNALMSLYVKNKKYDDLIRLLKEGVELNPADPNSHYRLGLVYEFNKEYDQAAEKYAEAVKLQGDHAKALNALGRVYMKTGRLVDAKDALEKAKAADPELEESSVLLNNIRDELSPESRKYKKKFSRKGKKSGKKGKATKSKKTKNSKTSKSKGNSKKKK